jgi:3-hydroxyisobutyrate dehydrogenase
MGAAIAHRLIETGNQVTVWNRSAEKSLPLVGAGAAVVTSPAELASAVEIVITILFDEAAIEQVYGSPSGLLAGDVEGKLFIEMSTVPPQVETVLAERVRARSAAFIECPVGGSTGPARQGKLIGSWVRSRPTPHGRSRCSTNCVGASSIAARSATAR